MPRDADVALGCTRSFVAVTSGAAGSFSADFFFAVSFLAVFLAGSLSTGSVSADFFGVSATIASGALSLGFALVATAVVLWLCFALCAATVDLDGDVLGAGVDALPICEAVGAAAVDDV